MKIMLDVVVNIAAIWGAILSTALAVIQLLRNKQKLLYEVQRTGITSAYVAKDSEYIESLFVNLLVRNHGKDTSVNNITLKIDGFKDVLRPKKSEPIYPEGEPDAYYFPEEDIHENLLRGGSKKYHLLFVDFDLQKLLSKKGTIKAKLKVVDTYKEKEIDVSFRSDGEIHE